VERVALTLPALRSIRQAVTRVQAAEALGFESVWVPQLETARDAAVILAAYAQNTSRIGLGTAVLPVLTRHPTAMAQLALTLDELSGGRFSLGLGLGHRVIARKAWGLDPEDSIGLLREYIAILRSSFKAGKSDFQGAHYSVHWTYEGPRRHGLRIFLGGLSRGLLRLAGEVADGVVLWLCTSEYVHSVVMPELAEGRQRAGLSMDGFEVMVQLPCCVTSDTETGLMLVRGLFRPAMNLPAYRRVLVESGFSAQVGAGELDGPSLGELAGVGSPETVRLLADRHRVAGCTLINLVPLPDHPGAAGLEGTLDALR
jgi:alkanesulfonate monooxygenase SsuD/methylene tetrahydromethanopterin reductase-like flavin-dependent oxidoreductase (luciferase family)